MCQDPQRVADALQHSVVLAKQLFDELVKAQEQGCDTVKDVILNDVLRELVAPCTNVNQLCDAYLETHDVVHLPEYEECKARMGDDVELLSASLRDTARQQVKGILGMLGIEAKDEDIF